MMQVLSASNLHSRFQMFTAKFLSHGGRPIVPLLRSFGSLSDSESRNPAVFCLESDDGSNLVVEVLALPLQYKPLFPGFCEMSTFVKDPKLLTALVESRKSQVSYVGAFLLKDETGSHPTHTPGSVRETNIYDLKGKELYNRLHEVGTLAQITGIKGDEVIFIGHQRLRITDTAIEDPLIVKVDHIKDKPYNNDDDVIKATSSELLSAIRDHLKTSALWKDETFFQHICDYDYPTLADFGAVISGASKLQCQHVLEELDVHKRLKMSLKLVKKMESYKQA